MIRLSRLLKPVLFLSILATCAYVIHRMQSIEEKFATYRLKRQKEIEWALKNFKLSEPLPTELHDVPFSDDMGVVLTVREINIPGAHAPYNASIVEDKEGKGFLLFFRYDEFAEEAEKYLHSYIGCQKLDKNLQVVGDEFIKINTGTKSSEDPRVVWVGGRLFLSYNDVVPHDLQCRSIRIAELDLTTMQPQYITDLDQNFQQFEKNWMPFELKNAQGKSDVCFIYSVYPHKIIRLPNPQENLTDHFVFPNQPGLQSLPWRDKFGPIRGGTPARLLDNGEYLSFFHSSFKDNCNQRWFTFGAYTFQANAPYRITSMSRHPILFKGIYQTSHMNTAPRYVRALYPCGMVFDTLEDGREVIHVSCGENDCAVKIVTFDKQRLLKSLKKISKKSG